MSSPTAAETDTLLSHWDFPHPPRNEQIQVMDWIDRKGVDKDFLSIEAPVGVGKSPVGVTFAQARGGSILVPQNSLQEQYLRDWPDIHHLRGTVHYSCHHGTANNPSCRRSKCDRKDMGVCPYSVAKHNFRQNAGSLTSYAMFLTLLLHGRPREDGEPLFINPWLVCDESHQLDEAITKVSEVAFGDVEYTKHTTKAFPLFTPEDPMLFADVVLNNLWDGLERSIAAQKDETPERLSWESLRDQIVMVLAELARDPNAWVCDVSEDFQDRSRRFYVRPILPKSFFRKHLDGQFLILGMSATPISPEVSRQIYGVDVDSFAVSSPFPVENRPIYYRPVAKMSYQNLAESVPVMGRAVSRTLSQFPDDKGIIHVSSFKLARDIYRCMDGAAQRRVLLHEPKKNRDDLLRQFRDAKGPVALMSPSISEGLDLKDDQGRFNIITKVPFPALNDPWIKARKNSIDGWYDWRTALSLAQASGRTTRHAEDYSTTVILDASFSALYNNSRKHFPYWFQEALQ